jgi:hypothetical protein
MQLLFNPANQFVTVSVNGALGVERSRRLPTGSPVEAKPLSFSKHSTHKKPHLSS